MQYIYISNWDKWQSYRSDRGTPPWIKIYRNLMTNAEWISLSDSEKGQLVSMWIAAADKLGKLPADKKVIKKICSLDVEPNINKFIDLGFLYVNDAKMTSNWRQLDAPETETETEERREDKKELCGYEFSTEVIAAWRKAYPNIDINTEISKAYAWEASNPKNAKKNKERFVNSWLSRAKPKPEKVNSDTSDKMALQKRLMGIEQ